MADYDIRPLQLRILKILLAVDKVCKGNPINCKVVVNHTVELTEEEKEQARQDAIERLRQEEMAKMRKHSQPKPTTEKKTQDVQPSLFDF